MACLYEAQMLVTNMNNLNAHLVWNLIILDFENDIHEVVDQDFAV